MTETSEPLPPLADRVALVTGATQGLGYEIARALARGGAQVYVNGRDRERTAARTATLGPEPDLLPLAFDVSDSGAAGRALEAIAARSGRLDILVNNVGQRDRRALEAFALDDVRRLLDINLVAPFELCRRGAALMDASGSIINMTSIAGPIANRGDAVYTMSKGGLQALTRALAAELGPRGIRVNGIAPGFFATERNQSMVADADTAAWLERRTSLGRWGRPEEIAGAAVFLASSAASYITGQVLAVDGGYLAHF